jgi:hypothetical protein
MSEFKVLELNALQDLLEYENVLDEHSLNSPFLQPVYLENFGGSFYRQMVFLWKGDNLVIMPINIHKIEFSDFYDSSSPKGYFGPYYGNSITQQDLKEFWINVDHWYRNNNVVSEFIRFRLENNTLCYTGSIVSTMDNIVVDLAEVNEKLGSFDRSVRKNFKTALKYNLEFEVYTGKIDDKVLANFQQVYLETMVRTKAKKADIYSFDSLRVLVSKNVSRCAISIVYDCGIPVSAELVLLETNVMYSFLGGTKAEYFSKRPNEFLKANIMQWAKKKGLVKYVLGGGYGSNDGIYEYKRKFAKSGVVPYQTGRKILSPDIYESLLKEKGNASNDSIDFFPAYRA